jgi:glycerate-2-kinase
MFRERFREDLLAIWRAGVAGVCVDRLICDNVLLLSPDDERNFDSRDYSILIGNGINVEQYSLTSIDRIILVGGGKASGGMAASLREILSPISGKVEISGWLNVPNDFAQPLDQIHLHASRPCGMNEPTLAAVAGTQEIIRILESLTRFDLCICLISGGGSALLPAPVSGISLFDKCELLRFLSGEGATIQEINTVRKIISRIKGGGLKRICYGKRLINLILSDVIGDSLDVIASGLTVDNNNTATDALNVLRKFTRDKSELLLQKSLHNIFSYLDSRAKNEQLLKLSQISNLSKTISTQKNSTQKNSTNNLPNYSSNNLSDNLPDNLSNDLSVNLSDKIFDSAGGFVRNIIIGNNVLAVEAAGSEALRRGYKPSMFSARIPEGAADELGVELVQLGVGMNFVGSDCLVHGGEPVVKLVSSDVRGVGGRNQQLVLSAVCELLRIYGLEGTLPIAILSAGTDGEDGPTDAAGAWIDPIAWELLAKKIKQDPTFNPESFLKQNNAYNFFKPLNTLLKTGITGTNVCDLRIILRCP